MDFGNIEEKLPTFTFIIEENAQFELAVSRNKYLLFPFLYSWTLLNLGYEPSR